MEKKKNSDLDEYNEASIPTPPDQEDISAVDMVSGAVEQFLDDILDDAGIEDKPKQ